MPKPPSQSLGRTAARTLFSKNSSTALLSDSEFLALVSSSFAACSAVSALLRSSNACFRCPSSSRLRASSSLFLPAKTLAKPVRQITPKTSTAAVLITNVRCRRSHRPTRPAIGSPYADTGSSPSQFSRSLPKSRAEP